MKQLHAWSKTAIAGTSRLRWSLNLAWIALWDEPAGDTSLCANGKVRMPADPEPKGRVHHAFMLDARTGQGALYYGTQLACGHLRPAHLETATTRFSVKWFRHGNGFVTYASPACGRPAGGALVRGVWALFVDAPMGPACADNTDSAHRISATARPCRRRNRAGRARSTPMRPLARTRIRRSPEG